MKKIDELLAFIKRRTGNDIDESTLRGHMSRLRKKMARCKIRRSLIETGVRSYRFKLLDDGRVIE